MRITRRIFAGAALLVLGASVLAQNGPRGLVKGGDYSEATDAGLPQTAPVEPVAEDVYAVGPYALHSPDLAPGDGLDAVHVYCQICHSNTYITMQPPHTAETWEAEIKKMREVHGAQIAEDVAQEILNYLRAHYTPETRKK